MSQIDGDDTGERQACACEFAPVPDIDDDPWMVGVADLSPWQTGLALHLYVRTKGGCPHIPRVRVASGWRAFVSGGWTSISIDPENPAVVSGYREMHDPKVIDEAKAFIAKHYDALLKVWEGECDASNLTLDLSSHEKARRGGMNHPNAEATTRLEVARLILEVYGSRRESAREVLARRLGLPNDGYCFENLWNWAEQAGGDELRQVVFVPDALGGDLDRLEAILEIEAGAYAPSVEEVYYVRNAVLGVWSHCYETVRKPGQWLTESVGEELPSIEVSITDLHQMVLALAEVGIANTPAQGRVSLIVLHEDGGIRFEVRDDGPPLDAELVDILSGNRPVSTCLGKPNGQIAKRLALGFVRTLATFYGGSSGFESLPGGGQLAWFSLPSGDPSGRLP